VSRTVLAIHGGCGVLPRAEMTVSMAADFRQGLEQSLRAGWAILEKGGPALDAVEAAVLVMEDLPLFNAGHGAVFNAEFGHELDAAIMDGADLRAGAVAAARAIRNPIRAARAVMEHTDCALLAGEGADAFAKQHGLEVVEQDYFSTEWRRRALVRMKVMEKDGTQKAATEAQKHGTVGAVALDARGHLAAATSTGGYTNKRLGRVGDSPILGAGTYAEDGVCAVSATGKGEFFMRKLLAYDIAARIKYRGETLAAACDALVQGELRRPGWFSGAGLVAVDAKGAIAMPYNTEGMYRGAVGSDRALSVAIYGD